MLVLFYYKWTVCNGRELSLVFNMRVTQEYRAFVADISIEINKRREESEWKRDIDRDTHIKKSGKQKQFEGPTDTHYTNKHSNKYVSSLHTQNFAFLLIASVLSSHRVFHILSFPPCLRFSHPFTRTHLCFFAACTFHLYLFLCVFFVTLKISAVWHV